MPDTIRTIELPADRRAFAVSDIHGELDYLKGLLDKIAFSPDDILLLLGDLIEKGPQSIETLRFIMRLQRTHTVYVVRGNCDGLLFDEATPDEWLFRFRHSWNGNMIMHEFARLLDCPVRSVEDVAALRRRVREQFPEETAFVTGLPVVLVSEHYIFVHGGIPGEESLDRPELLMPWKCMKNDNFVGQGWHFRRRWCVVGHWPTTLYRKSWPCADPLVRPDQQIVSIDGGCAIKRDGQLNALRLPPRPGADGFTWTSYDLLPTAKALDPQRPSEGSYNICHGDNALEILDRGEEFCTCRHCSTGRVMDILTCDIRETPRGVFCEDSTDYLLPVRPGDVLSLIKRTSRGWLVKKDGVTGWYAGRLEGRA